MKKCKTQSAKPQLQNNQLWQPLDTAQSQSISGGILFANPFAPASMTPSLAGRLGIGG